MIYEYADHNSPPTPFSTDERLRRSLTLWASFASTLNTSDKVALVYHADTDGVVSAAYLKNYLSKAGIAGEILPYWVKTEEYDFRKVLRWLQMHAFDHCIFVDISIENSVSMLSQVKHTIKGNVFIYDHHVTRNNLTDFGIYLANPTPRPLKGDEIPLPSFAFAMELARAAALPFPPWLLLHCIFAEGVDHKLETLINQLLQDSYSYDRRVPPREFYRKLPYTNVGSLIRAGFDAHCSEQHVLESVEAIIRTDITSLHEWVNLLSPLYSSVAQEIANEISKTIDHWIVCIQAMPENSTQTVKIAVTRASVAGPVASVLRSRFPQRAFIAYAIREQIATVEIRISNSSTTNLVAVLEEIALTVPLVNFGGHPSAAGALVYENALPLLLQELCKKLGT